MKAIEGFERAINRAIYLVDLYDLLHNKRSRSVRKPFADKIISLFGWPKRSQICLVQGSGSVLLIRDGEA